MAINSPSTNSTDSVLVDPVLEHSITGTGRCYVVLVEDHCKFKEVAKELVSLLTEIGQVHLISIKQVSHDWRSASTCLLDFLEAQEIRSASFIAFEDATVLVQAISLRRARLVRTLFLIDAATRAHPSSWVQFIERIEGYLPLGLPFRSDFPGFDGKPFLQRIRCPVLIGLTTDADQYRKEQASLFIKGMPTSFLMEFKSDKLAQDLAQAFKDFQVVPAKMPQKNIR